VNFALSIFSAVLLILIFPRYDLTWLAPVALTPLLFACAREESWKRRFLQGWAGGFVFWFGVCTWIQFVLEVHGGMGKWGGWGTFVLFAILKGLHMAVFAALAGFVMPRWWAIPASAALWAGLERTHGPFGFAWLDLGNAGADAPGAHHRSLRIVIRVRDDGVRVRPGRIAQAPARTHVVADSSSHLSFAGAAGSPGHASRIGGATQC
jgi:apolipoprotein N-acyltransferase